METARALPPSFSLVSNVLRFPKSPGLRGYVMGKYRNHPLDESGTVPKRLACPEWNEAEDTVSSSPGLSNVAARRAVPACCGGGGISGGSSPPSKTRPWQGGSARLRSSPVCQCSVCIYLYITCKFATWTTVLSTAIYGVSIDRLSIHHGRLRFYHLCRKGHRRRGAPRRSRP
jgi:hypothetical protein